MKNLKANKRRILVQNCSQNRAQPTMLPLSSIESNELTHTHRKHYSLVS